MTAPITMVQRAGQNPAARSEPLTGGTAVDYSFDATNYNQLLIVADAANTTPVFFRSNTATGGTDPTLPSGSGNVSRFIEIGAAILLTMHETQVLRFKSSADATIRIMPYSGGNPAI